MEAEKLVLQYFKQFIEDAKYSGNLNKLKLAKSIEGYIVEYKKALISKDEEIKKLLADISNELKSLPAYKKIKEVDFLIDNEKNIKVSIDKRMVEKFSVKTEKRKVIFEPKDELIPLSFKIDVSGSEEKSNYNYEFKLDINCPKGVNYYVRKTPH